VSTSFSAKALNNKNFYRDTRYGPALSSDFERVAGGCLLLLIGLAHS